jgi:hypothetical protein
MNDQPHDGPRAEETYQPASAISDPEHTGQVRTAHDVKDVHRRLEGFSDDELKAIPILPAGTRLEQGAVYVDLRSDRSEARATAEMIAGPDNAYAPKDSVDYQLWNRLLGVTNPERTGAADE